MVNKLHTCQIYTTDFMDKVCFQNGFNDFCTSKLQKQKLLDKKELKHRFTKS